ncbi:capsule biosynthesis protein [Rhodoferax antarcticus]|uniref:capsule biosynthesis protein n=1 Tax=Rhodoferax antarcticus TaxID=81479 RepID=UPI0022257707|nr:capsular biosynthesis protein [Rhodoferax antarcticus]MCW2312499.1 capsular polysaccharide export protein [Rhodoferax antarcticus]
MSRAKRNFLFLQGPSTPFFAKLADRLKTDGHRVFRINFSAGDALHWGLRSARNYRGGLADLRNVLDEKYRKFDITDQVLFGDMRPVHQPALAQGKVCEVRTHVFEEGYFRPHWVTLERDGVNSHSLLPRDPEWFRDVGTTLQAPGNVVPFQSSFQVRAMHDVLYHVAGALNPVLFSGYQTHAPITAPLEYAAYLKRFSMLKLIREREHRRAKDLVASGVPYYVLPLQLNTDVQIRVHSRFADMREVIEHVLESFARSAPGAAKIVIKNHPLDMGLMNFNKIIRDCERQLAIEGRVVYLEDGNLVALVRRSQGVVTVNSTAGMVALEEGRPTLTLSDPIYNLPGLTCQMSLDDFWRRAHNPDAELFARFRRVLMAATQVNGGFYCRSGIGLAAENSSRVLTAERSPLEVLL